MLHIGQQVLEKITSFNIRLGFFGGLLSFFIVCLITIDIVGRSIFSSPLPGASEYSTALLVLLIYLGFPATQASKGNFRLELFIQHLPRRIQKSLELSGLTILICGMTFFAYFATLYAIEMTAQQELTFGNYQIPLWPQRLIISFSFILLILQFVVDFINVIYNRGYGFSADENSFPENVGDGI